MANAIESYNAIRHWILSSNKESQLDVMASFVIEHFSIRFTPKSNLIHAEMIADMFNLIEKQKDKVVRCEDMADTHTMD